MVDAHSSSYPITFKESTQSVRIRSLYFFSMGDVCIPIVEKTTAWSYALPDGSNAPRQLTDAGGEVTFATRYTPWGDTLETYGKETLPSVISAA